MTREEAATLKSGEYVQVEYATSKRQLAYVERGGLTLGGNVRVKKFLANSRRWTAVVSVRPYEVLCRVPKP